MKDENQMIAMSRWNKAMCVVAGRLGGLFVGFPVCWTCWERWLKMCVALPRASGSGVTVHMGDGGVGRILLQATPSGGVFVIEGTFYMGANGVSSSIEMSRNCRSSMETIRRGSGGCQGSFMCLVACRERVGRLHGPRCGKAGGTGIS